MDTMKRLVCYAHFDGNGQVRPFVLHALKLMVPLCLDLVFVSNSPLTDHDLALLSKSCSNIIVNNNTGYDFYMWKLGLESVDLSIYDEVMLMNSSVFGPLFDMDSVFVQMSQLPCDFWGITECFQMQPHLQTYFLVFNKKIIVSDAFKIFWCGILPYTNKMQVIQSYEVGLTQWLVESGFKPGVLCPFDSIGRLCTAAGKRLRRKDNTSVKFALELLEAGSPFLKRDAVRNRKVAIDMVMPLLQKMGYPTALIDEKYCTIDQSCPVCGAVGRLWRRGVRNFISLHDTERYDYLRCTSKACGIVWLKDSGQTARSIVVPEIPKDEKALGTVYAVRENSQAQSDMLLITNTDIIRYGDICVSNSKVFLAKVTDDGGIEVLCPSSPSGEYDAVIIKSCLEQVHDPGRLLKNAYCYLKPGGTLYVETLNSDSVVGGIFQGYWSCLHAPYARYLFSYSVLHSLLVSSGYESIEVVSQFSHVWQSVFASFEAIRNKRISLASMPVIFPLNKAENSKCATLLSKFIPSWGETLCAVARRVKGV
jgi:hypothetical protein